MTLVENILCPRCMVFSSKNTPGLLWSWFTMTRSAPFITNDPVAVISGSSPRKTD